MSIATPTGREHRPATTDVQASPPGAHDYHDRFAHYYDLFYESRDVVGEVEQAIELVAPGKADRRQEMRLLDLGVVRDRTLWSSQPVGSTW